MTPATRKRLAWERIQRIIAHRDNPSDPVDSATLLREEASRLRTLEHRVARKMAWAFDLAAAKLDAIQDPAMQTRFQKIPNARDVAATDPTPRS